MDFCVGQEYLNIDPRVSDRVEGLVCWVLESGREVANENYIMRTKTRCRKDGNRGEDRDKSYLDSWEMNGFTSSKKRESCEGGFKCSLGV